MFARYTVETAYSNCSMFANALYRHLNGPRRTGLEPLA